MFAIPKPPINIEKPPIIQPARFIPPNMLFVWLRRKVISLRAKLSAWLGLSLLTDLISCLISDINSSLSALSNGFTQIMASVFLALTRVLIKR